MVDPVDPRLLGTEAATETKVPAGLVEARTEALNGHKRRHVREAVGTTAVGRALGVGVPIAVILNQLLEDGCGKREGQNQKDYYPPHWNRGTLCLLAGHTLVNLGQPRKFASATAT